MYQGKHTQRAVPKRHRRLRWRKEFLMVCSVLVLLIGVVGGTIAYLTTNTDPVKNTFTPATSDIHIDEKFDNETKENVKVENKSDYPVYARATYVAYWVSDADGSVIPGEPELKETMGSDWTYREDDGYWYYNKVLSAGDKSTDFIVSMTADKVKDQHLVVDVIMETVQAEPIDAIQEVWSLTPSVNTDGTVNFAANNGEVTE